MTLLANLIIIFFTDHGLLKYNTNHDQHLKKVIFLYIINNNVYNIVSII